MFLIAEYTTKCNLKIINLYKLVGEDELEKSSKYYFRVARSQSIQPSAKQKRRCYGFGAGSSIALIRATK